VKGQTLPAFIKLVVFAVVTVVLTAILAVTITNGSVGNTQRYKAVFSDASGLIKNDDVRVAGVRVGQVSDVTRVGRDKAQVTFSLKKDVPLHSNAQIAIKYRNLVGQRYVDVQETPGAAPVLPAGATIPVAQTQGPLDLTTLFDGFKPLFQALTPEQINNLSGDIIRTLQGEGSSINGLLTSTASLTNTIADRDATIGNVVTNLTTVLSVVDQHNQGLDQLIVQLQRLVTGVAGDRQTIATALTNINGLTTSATQLLADIRPSLPTDLQALSAVTNTLATTTNGNGQVVLDEYLQRLPSKLNTILRTATYGSWFNFWLCDAELSLGGSAAPIKLANNDAACTEIPK
jgi:phospholipid/cholesterol/gamma-HCH transport system substrate-binding protein